MDVQPQAALMYEPQRPQRPRWLWFGGGLLCGVLASAVALPVINSIRESRNRIQVGSTATGQIRIVTSSPSSPAAGSSFAFPQGDGQLHFTADGIGVPYGKFILLKSADDGVVGLRITCPSGGDGSTVRYDWVHRPPSAGDFSGTDVRSGSGQAVEKTNSAFIHAGPFHISWSRGSAHGGWLYWPGARHEGMLIATTTADFVEALDETVADAEWRDDEGTTMKTGKIELTPRD